MIFGIEAIYLIGAGLLTLPPTVYVFWKSRESCRVEKEAPHIIYDLHSGTIYRS